MNHPSRKIHYLLLNEDYYTSAYLRRMIGGLRPDYVFSGNSESALEGNGIMKTAGIDLVIADIQLAEGIFFKLVPPEKCPVPLIVFAENEFFLSEMKEYNLVDYRLKPVSCEDMESSLNKFEENYQLKS